MLRRQHSNYGNSGVYTGALAERQVFILLAVMDILDYANTNKYKTLRVYRWLQILTGAGELEFQSGHFGCNTAAITSYYNYPNITVTILLNTHTSPYTA
jgi:hypothetical protein